MEMITEFKSPSRIEREIERRGYRIASSLISREGDEAEGVVYCARLSQPAKEALLGRLKVRRIHLHNKRGY